MTTVLILGASGGIGLESVHRALDAGHEVRALARTADRIAADHRRLRRISGDALDRDTVVRALDGVGAVIQTLGVAVNAGNILEPVTLFSRATTILVEEMERAGTRRLICVTGFGAGDSRSKLSLLEYAPYRLVLGRVYDDKTRQEDIIKASRLDWTIARPGILTRGPRTGIYQVLVEPEQWHNGLISRADVADFLIGEVENRRLTGKAPVLVY